MQQKKNFNFVVPCPKPYLQRVLESIVELHDRRLVAAPVAVVGGAEDGHHVPVVAPVVAFHDQLMGARDERQPIGVVERLRDVLAERIARPARRDAPSPAVVRVRPQQVTHRTLVRNLNKPTVEFDAILPI